MGYSKDECIICYSKESYNTDVDNTSNLCEKCFDEVIGYSFNAGRVRSAVENIDYGVCHACGQSKNSDYGDCIRCMDRTFILRVSICDEHLENIDDDDENLKNSDDEN